MIFRTFRQYGVKPKVAEGREGGREGRVGGGRTAADSGSSGLGLCSRAVAAEPGRPEAAKTQENL